MLKELDRLEILVFAVFVRNPLTVLLAVIQIKHGSHRVYPQAVDMEFLQPVDRVGNQEILHLIFPVVKNLCPPVRMLSLPWIGILKQSAAVEICQTMGILREMSRNPVEDYSDTVLMELIDHIVKILGRSVARRRRVVAGNLIAPGPVKGMLRNSDQLDMSIVHIQKILGNSVCKLAVIIEALVVSAGVAHPRTDMALINSNGRFFQIRRVPLLHPRLIRPDQLRDIRSNGSGTGTKLTVIREGIRLIMVFALLVYDQVFIKLSARKSRNKAVVNPKRLLPCHKQRVLIPAVKASDQAYLLGIRRPDREIITALPVLLCRVRA